MTVCSLQIMQKFYSTHCAKCGNVGSIWNYPIFSIVLKTIHEFKHGDANGDQAPQVLQSADILTSAADVWNGFRPLSLEVQRRTEIAKRQHEAPLTPWNGQEDWVCRTTKFCANSPATSELEYLCSPLYTNIQGDPRKPDIFKINST